MNEEREKIARNLHCFKPIDDWWISYNLQAAIYSKLQILTNSNNIN